MITEVVLGVYMDCPPGEAFIVLAISGSGPPVVMF